MPAQKAMPDSGSTYRRVTKRRRIWMCRSTVSSLQVVPNKAWIYLGSIQAFSLYKPRFLPVPVSQEGMDPGKLRAAISLNRPRLMYAVPNFQNPSGISYAEQNRRDLSRMLEGTDTLLIEDDPYGD